MISEKFVLGFFKTGTGRKGYPTFAILHESAGVIIGQVVKANTNFGVEIAKADGCQHIYPLKDSISQEIIGYAIGVHTTEEELTSCLTAIKAKEGHFYLHLDVNYITDVERKNIINHKLWKVMKNWQN